MTDQQSDFDLKTICDLFTRGRDLYPTEIALSSKAKDGRVDLSYKELAALSETIALNLLKKNVPKGYTTIIALPPSIDWPIALGGAIKAGLVALPILPSVSTSEMKEIIAAAEGKVLIYDDVDEQRWDKINIPLKFSIQELFLADEQREPEFPRISPVSRALAYNIGNKGDKPFIIKLSHRCVLSNLKAMAEIKKSLAEEDTFFSTIPPTSFASTLITQLLPLYFGSKILYPDSSLKGDELINKCSSMKITNLIITQELLVDFLQINLKQLIKFEKIPMVSKNWTVGDFANFLRPVIDKQTGIHPRQTEFCHFLGNSLKNIILLNTSINPNWSTICNALDINLFTGLIFAAHGGMISWGKSKDCSPHSFGSAIPGTTISFDDGLVCLGGDHFILSINTDKNRNVRTNYLGSQNSAGDIFCNGLTDETDPFSSGNHYFSSKIEQHFYHGKISEICITENEDKSLTFFIRPALPVISEKNIKKIISERQDDLDQPIKINKIVISHEPMPKTHLGEIDRKAVKKKLEKNS